ncbi:MAG: class I mannose-6-phosphate isomerase [Acidobacteriia bacterium]|nr:class I mannose-6-phosphate isomerase [Terriglobia bacterium]
MIVCPARLEPTFSPRPWGSLSLAPFFPEKANLAEPLGEAWLTGSDCRFTDGPFAGKTLGEAWPVLPPEWTGTQVERGRAFPILVKFIFPEEKLSVQVHPDDDYASRHEQKAGGRGKTEMWYALRARPGAEVLVGLKPSVTREQFQRAIADGTAENCLEHIPLRPGDAVFVPAGTAHTIGPGLVLCEIQQHSDLTYRVYDYNRRDAQGRARELHIEKALDVMRFGKQMGGKVEPVRILRGPLTETHYAACRYFAAEQWEFSESIGAATSREHFDLLIFLEGSGSIHWSAERAEYAPAQVWLIPAALGDYRLAPDARTSLLRAYVPGDLDQLGRRLAERGVAEAEWSRLVHR